MSEDEGMLRGFHGAPSDEALRSMSYTALCAAIADAEPGGVAHQLLEAEKCRRGALQQVQESVHQVEEDLPRDVEERIDVKRNDPLPGWHTKPAGAIFIGAIIAVVGAAALKLLRDLGLIL